jgi:3-phosphoshikimate 1-carboxyvinyltransferase
MPGGKLDIEGLNPESRQGDRAIAAILKKMGAQATWAEGVITMSEGTRSAVEIDATAIPDLIPVLSAVAAVSRGCTIVKNAGRLRLKESDRLAATADVLNTLGAKVKETPEGLHIDGVPGLIGGTVDAWGDHRIAMMAAVASTACREPVTINGAHAVRKSYPQFWEELAKLGKEVHIIEEGAQPHV